MSQLIVTDQFSPLLVPWEGKNAMFIHIHRIKDPRIQLFMARGLNQRITFAVHNLFLQKLFVEILGEELSENKPIERIGRDDFLLFGEYRGPTCAPDADIPVAAYENMHWYQIAFDINPSSS